jgi:hypothetical protein
MGRNRLRGLHAPRSTAIYRGKETTPKTPAALRDRPIVPELRQALLNHKVMAVYREPSDYVFASASGMEEKSNPALIAGAPFVNSGHVSTKFVGEVISARKGEKSGQNTEWSRT